MAKRQPIFQYHLNLPGMSGRRVRVRLLTPSEKRAADAAGADSAGNNASIMALVEAQRFECWKRTVTEVTEEDELKTILGDEVKWHKLTLQDLEMPGPYNVDQLFTCKDTEMLELIFKNYHDVGQAELHMLSGKALPVATEG